METEKVIGGHIMFCHQKKQVKFLAIVLIIFILMPFIGMSAEMGRRSSDGNIEGWVSSINREVLFVEGQEYKLSGNVRVFIGSESGWEVTLNTITDVGYIDKARIYIDKGQVQRIIILEVQQ